MNLAKTPILFTLLVEIDGISSEDIKAMLIKQSEYKYTGKTFDGVCIMGATGYDECVKNEKKLGDEKKAHFNATFASEIERLSKRGYEFQNGMIVKSLSNEENHLLGISAVGKLAEETVKAIILKNKIDRVM